MPYDKYILKHTLLLLFTVFLVFLWAISPYDSFATQIVSSLLAVYILKHVFRSHLERMQQSLIDSLILTALVLVIITVTGELSSPFFFLIFFLLFALSLMLNPTIPLILSFSLLVYFLFTSTITKTSELLPLLSFPLITPLAVYFGKQHSQTVWQKRDILRLKQSLERETEDVFLWLTTLFSQELEQLLDMINRFPHLSVSQKPFLENIKTRILGLKKLGQRLKQAIEED